mgnify:CR=1 FL=1
MIADALVSLWKDDSDGDTDGEVFINGYTDSEGQIQFIVNTQTEGEIRFSVRVDGESIQQNTGTIPVVAAVLPVSSPMGLTLLLGALLGSGLATLRAVRRHAR